MSNRGSVILPEPEGRLAGGGFRPGLDMQTIPLREAVDCGRVAGEAGHPVGSVRDDHDRARPVGYISMASPR